MSENRVRFRYMSHDKNWINPFELDTLSHTEQLRHVDALCPCARFPHIGRDMTEARLTTP